MRAHLPPSVLRSTKISAIHLGALRSGLVSRYLGCTTSFRVPQMRLDPRRRADAGRRGIVLPVCPTPALDQGDRRTSQVPELPPWMHAPLCYPGRASSTWSPWYPGLLPSSVKRLSACSMASSSSFVHYVVDFGADSRSLHPCSTLLRTTPLNAAHEGRSASVGWTPTVLDKSIARSLSAWGATDTLSDHAAKGQYR